MQFWDVARANSPTQTDAEYRRLRAMPVTDYFDLLANLKRFAERDRAGLKKNSNFEDE